MGHNPVLLGSSILLGIGERTQWHKNLPGKPRSESFISGGGEGSQGAWEKIATCKLHRGLRGDQLCPHHDSKETLVCLWLRILGLKYLLRA